MKLYIDTTNRDKVIIALDDKKFELISHDSKSQKLLEFIDETLESEGLKINEITEIDVNTGPGSYTGIRIGVSVAQTIGWSQSIPVNGKNMNNGETIEIIYQ